MAQVADYARERYARDPGYRERKCERSRAWRGANPEKARAKEKAHTQRRRALKAAVTTEYFTLGELYASWDTQGVYACVYCDKPYEHADHIVPLARGGAHTVGNLQPVCAEHNLSKGARDPLEFAASIVGQHVVDWALGRG